MHQLAPRDSNVAKSPYARGSFAQRPRTNNFSRNQNAVAFRRCCQPFLRFRCLRRKEWSQFRRGVERMNSSIAMATYLCNTGVCKTHSCVQKRRLRCRPSIVLRRLKKPATATATATSTSLFVFHANGNNSADDTSSWKQSNADKTFPQGQLSLEEYARFKSSRRDSLLP